LKIFIAIARKLIFGSFGTLLSFLELPPAGRRGE
jgi:hypothetical protein